jgi:hypothetical protein
MPDRGINDNWRQHSREVQCTTAARFSFVADRSQHLQDGEFEELSEMNANPQERGGAKRTEKLN